MEIFSLEVRILKDKSHDSIAPNELQFDFFQGKAFYQEPTKKVQHPKRNSLIQKKNLCEIVFLEPYIQGCH